MSKNYSLITYRICRTEGEGRKVKTVEAVRVFIPNLCRVSTRGRVPDNERKLKKLSKQRSRAVRAPVLTIRTPPGPSKCSYATSHKHIPFITPLDLAHRYPTHTMYLSSPLPRIFTYFPLFLFLIALDNTPYAAIPSPPDSLCTSRH